MQQDKWYGPRPFQLHIDKCLSARLPIIVYAFLTEQNVPLDIEGSTFTIEGVTYKVIRKPSEGELEIYRSLPKLPGSKRGTINPSAPRIPYVIEAV